VSQSELPALRKLLITKLNELGISPTQETLDKDRLRQLHAKARELEIEKQRVWIDTHYHKYEKYVARPEEIYPKKIRPKLVEVVEQEHFNLFRFARLVWWSLPHTWGYGRRVQFLIVDEQNEKLMGLIGMQSPPIDLPARDRLFSYPKDRKIELVNQTMDIFTLGSFPPYNELLGGKLAAFTAASNEVRKAYIRKYRKAITEMRGEVLPPNLIALTTTSAYGRSSIYNRLKYRGQLLGKSIGYTEGYGSFHLHELYPLFKRFLELQGIEVKGGYGVGPRIRWQICEKAMNRLGFHNDPLRHGIKREVFLFSLIKNLQSFMGGRSQHPRYFNRPFEELSNWWIEKLMLPRSERLKEIAQTPIEELETKQKTQTP